MSPGHDLKSMPPSYGGVVSPDLSTLFFMTLVFQVIRKFSAESDVIEEGGVPVHAEEFLFVFIFNVAPSNCIAG